MAADDYEQKFMDGDAAVYSERHVSRLFAAFLGVVALIALVSGIAVLFSAKAPAAAAIGPFFASALVAFNAVYWAVMRIKVTSDMLHVDYGMLGVRVPLAAITECTFASMIGAGAKWSPGGWRYAPLGTRRGVWVTWREKDKTKKCYIGANDPEALAKSIEAGQSKQIRIAEAPAATDDAALEEAANAEAEAATIGESTKKKA